MMELFLTRRFIKRFERIPKEYQLKVRQVLDEIAKNPWSGKKLSGPLEGDYSWRVGSYRIIYTVQGSRIFAETVSHRKEVDR